MKVIKKIQRSFFHTTFIFLLTYLVKLSLQSKVIQLRPTNNPLINAPRNSTQFIIDDHENSNLFWNFDAQVEQVQSFPDPVFEMRPDPDFKIWSDPVWTSRFIAVYSDQSYNTVLKYRLFWLLCRKKKSTFNLISY